MEYRAFCYTIGITHLITANIRRITSSFTANVIFCLALTQIHQITIVNFLDLQNHLKNYDKSICIYLIMYGLVLFRRGG